AVRRRRERRRRAHRARQSVQGLARAPFNGPPPSRPAAAASERGFMTDLNDTGEWVTHPAWAKDSPPWEQPTLRRVWRLDAAPRRATMRVLAVGVWEAHIGGRRVGDARLEPGSSDVAQRLAERIEDVTELLRAGDNEFVLQLGEGPSYVRRAPGRYTKFDRLVVAPRARVALEVEEADGSVRLFGSDASWQSRLGPTTLAHWYGGEEYD